MASIQSRQPHAPREGHEAETQTYGRNATPYKPGRCVEAVYGTSIRGWSHQCSRAAVAGPELLYCKQHDPVRVAERNKEFEEKYKRERRERTLGWLGPRVLKALVAQHEKRLKATMTGQYDGSDEVEEVIRIAKGEGFTA